MRSVKIYLERKFNQHGWAVQASIFCDLAVALRARDAEQLAPRLRDVFRQAAGAALAPACIRLDQTLALAGPRGIQKSSAIIALAPEIETDLGRIPSYAIWRSGQRFPDALVAELDFELLHVERTKVDLTKPRCGLAVVTMPSATPFDRTNTRRLQIVNCSGPIDVRWIEDHRDLIWGEAVRLLRESDDNWKRPN